MKKILKVLVGAKKWFIKLSLKKKVIFLSVIVLILGFSFYRIITSSKKQEVQYQTAIAEKGTLINSIASSGSITSGNNSSVNTKVSGVVKEVYVTNGDTVAKGQKIAEITLDDYAQERQTAAWVSYLEAKETAMEAISGKAETDIAMWQARQDILDAQNAFDLMNYYATASAQPVYSDNQKTIITKTLDQKRLAFNVAESKYLNANSDIANANAKVSAALRNYQENSATIIAPSAGVISDITLAPGIVLNANSSTSSTSGATIVSNQTIGKISNPQGQLTANVSLTEVDIVNIKANQKVILTIDAYPDNTFTGKVLAVNTSGSVSSGVTSYPVTILLDSTTVDIYPNMAVNAEIITNVKTDVILAPSSAIKTTNEQSIVQIKKDEKISDIQVEIGDSNDSQTEIVSGVNEGDEIVISTIISGSSNTQSNTSSPFGGTTNIRMPGSFPGR